jgi:hypothetical protein
VSLNPVRGYRTAIPATHSPAEPRSEVLRCILCQMTSEGRLPDLYLPLHDRSNWSQVAWRPALAATHGLVQERVVPNGTDGKPVTQWVPRPMEPTYVPAPYPWDDPTWVEFCTTDE